MGLINTDTKKKKKKKIEHVKNYAITRKNNRVSSLRYLLKRNFLLGNLPCPRVTTP